MLNGDHCAIRQVAPRRLADVNVSTVVALAASSARRRRPSLGFFATTINGLFTATFVRGTDSSPASRCHSRPHEAATQTNIQQLPIPLNRFDRATMAMSAASSRTRSRQRRHSSAFALLSLIDRSLFLYIPLRQRRSRLQAGHGPRGVTRYISPRDPQQTSRCSTFVQFIAGAAPIRVSLCQYLSC